MQNSENISNRNSSSESGWESLEDFAGERNINSKTGKPRTFTEFDNYPKMPGESNEEYGERLRFMHQRLAEVEATEANRAVEEAQSAERDAYFVSEQGQKELNEEAKFDRLTKKLDQAVAEGRMDAEHARNLMEQQLERSVHEIEGHRQDYQDRQVTGDAEDAARYEAWSRDKDPEFFASTATETSEKAPNEALPVDELTVEEAPEIKLSPEIQADLDDKLADIAKWRERDANRIWRGESGHGQEFYDKMVAEVTAEAIAMNQAFLESQTKPNTEIASELTDENPDITVDTAESPNPLELEEQEKSELEEIAGLQLRVAELEHKTREAKLEILTQKEEKIRVLDKKIAEMREELRLIDEARKEPKTGLLMRIFGGKKKAKTASSKNSTPEVTISPISEDSSHETVTTPTTSDEKSYSLADSIRKDKLGGRLDDEGVAILTNEEGINDENSVRIDAWWSTLNDDTKREITLFEKGLGNSKYGRALRAWLQINNYF